MRVGCDGAGAMRAQLIAVLVASLAAMALAGPAVSATASDRLVYMSDWSGVPQLYAADPSGSAPTRQLVSPCGLDFDTSCRGRWAFSPGGRRLLFVRAVSPKLDGVFLSDADGSHVRVVETMPRDVYPPRGLFWSPDARGFGWTDERGLHFVQAGGAHVRVVLPGGVHSFSWSPGGRSYTYVTATGDLIVRAAAGTHTTVAARDVGRYAWAPSGGWLAVEQPLGWSIVHPDGSGRRYVAKATPLYDVTWSADGRWLALAQTDAFDASVFAYDTRTGKIDPIAPFVAPVTLTWSPVHDRLAIADPGPLRVADLDRGELTTFPSEADPTPGVRWSPDGARLALLAPGAAVSLVGLGTDIDVAELDGTVHTIVRADGPFGGTIRDLEWARLPPRTKLAVAQRSLGPTTPTQLYAPWEITRLAVDGDRVAYEACGHVFVWTPATQTVEQADPIASLTPWCNGDGRIVINYLYDLALAGDDVLYAAHFNSTSTYWTVTRTTLGAQGGALREIDFGYGLVGGPYNPALGQLAGAGSLLVYSRWQESYQRPNGQLNWPITSTTVERIEPDGTTTPLHLDPGPLVTGNVDDGRIALYGTKAVLVLDRDGHQLLSLPVAALGVRLDGTELAVLTQSRLHEYDAITGEELHSWPLPDVLTGEYPGSPDFRSPPPALDLDGLAHGLALYHVNGQIHLLRLSDGQDATLAPGTLARFTSTGVVYASGKTLTLVPFTDLPLH